MKISSTIALLTLCAVLNDVCAMERPVSGLGLPAVHDENPLWVASSFQPVLQGPNGGSIVMHQDKSRLGHLQYHANNNQNMYGTREQLEYHVMAKVEVIERKGFGDFTGQLVAEKFQYKAPSNIGKEYNDIRDILVSEVDCNANASVLREAAFYGVIMVYANQALERALELRQARKTAHKMISQLITSAEWHEARLELMAMEKKLKYLIQVLSAFAGKNTAERTIQFNTEEELKKASPTHFKSGLHYNPITTNGPVTDMLRSQKAKVTRKVVKVTGMTKKMDFELNKAQGPNSELQGRLDVFYQRLVDTTARDIAKIRAELNNLHVTLEIQDKSAERFCVAKPEDRPLH